MFHMSDSRARGLLALENSLDKLISRNPYIGPPLPTTDAEKNAWIFGFNSSNPPPTLAQWIPPWYIDRCNQGAGFMLNDQTACFQRGFCPDDVYRAIIPVIAEGFHHGVRSIENVLQTLDYDYIVAIRHHETHEIAAVCMVEVRCSQDAKDIPCLYVFELTTNKRFGRHGLAQQLTHAVDALAYFLKSDPDRNNIWYDTLKDKRLFTSLTVAKDQEKSYMESLIRLYSRAGFQLRNASTPSFDYDAFTPYSAFDWKIDQDVQYIAMWKEIQPNAIYSDDKVTIWKSNDTGNENIHSYYHPFPADQLQSVMSHGIVHPSHRCLHGSEKVYVADGSTIRFSRDRPSTPYFEVWAECRQDSFEMHTSIPKWFALRINEKATDFNIYETESAHHQIRPRC